MAVELYSARDANVRFYIGDGVPDTILVTSLCCRSVPIWAPVESLKTKRWICFTCGKDVGIDNGMSGSLGTQYKLKYDLWKEDADIFNAGVEIFIEDWLNMADSGVKVEVDWDA